MVRDVMLVMIQFSHIISLIPLCFSKFGECLMVFHHRLIDNAATLVQV